MGTRQVGRGTRHCPQQPPDAVCGKRGGEAPSRRSSCTDCGHPRVSRKWRRNLPETGSDSPGHRRSACRLSLACRHLGSELGSEVASCLVSQAEGQISVLASELPQRT